MENLNVCTRHGWMSHFFHTLATVTLLIPSSLPNSRDDQCVMPNRGGGASNVRTTTADSSTTAGRPDRGASVSAASPPMAYRPRHRFTVGRDTPTRWAISVFASPCPASSTIRAR